MQNFIKFLIYPPHRIAAKMELWRGYPPKNFSHRACSFHNKTTRRNTKRGYVFQNLPSESKTKKPLRNNGTTTDCSVCACYVTAFARELPHVKYVIFGCIRISPAGNTHNGEVCPTQLLGVLVYHIGVSLSRRNLSIRCNFTK